MLGLAAMTALLASGAGIEGAIIGTAIGTAVAAIVAVVLLRGSYEPYFDPAEVKQIILRGRHRAPIVLSFWLVQNADVFILSRFISHTELGVYALASRLGFVVSFLPQGFRMAMRPLRKSAPSRRVQRPVRRATVQRPAARLLHLLCIFAVLVMILGGEVLVDAAPAAYAAAAGLIPFTAAGLRHARRLPDREPERQPEPQADAVHPRRARRRDLVRRHHRVLAPEIGAYAAPVGMLFGFGVPSLLMFARNQRGKRPIDFPYRAVALGARDRRRDRRPLPAARARQPARARDRLAGPGRLPRRSSSRCG